MLTMPVMCVDTKALPVDPKVCKDIDVQDLLTRCIKPFSDLDTAAQEGYVPVDFAISTRSIYDNTVLSYQRESGVQYYVRMNNIGPFHHRGLDLFMYLSSLAFLESVEYTKEVDSIMFQHSQFQPVGLYYPKVSETPIFYAHLLLSDPGMKLLEPHLKLGVTVTPIQSMTHEGNLSALLETLIIVKEEHHE